MDLSMLLKIITAPGRFVLRYLPNLGGEESRLLHNMVNYVVWLTLLIGTLIYVIIKNSAA